MIHEYTPFFMSISLEIHWIFNEAGNAVVNVMKIYLEFFMLCTCLCTYHYEFTCKWK